MIYLYSKLASNGDGKKFQPIVPNVIWQLPRRQLRDVVFSTLMKVQQASTSANVGDTRRGLEIIHGQKPTSMALQHKILVSQSQDMVPP